MLCNDLEMTDPKQQVKPRMQSEHPNIILLQWAAWRHQIDGSLIWMALPSLELEVDVKGSIAVTVVGPSAKINVGEIKMKLPTSKSKTWSQT